MSGTEDEHAADVAALLESLEEPVPAPEPAAAEPVFSGDLIEGSQFDDVADAFMREMREQHLRVAGHIESILKLASGSGASNQRLRSIRQHAQVLKRWLDTGDW